VLVVGPWTAWWSRNIFADMVPWLQPIMASAVTRAGVVTMGLVTVLAGLSEVRGMLAERARRRASEAGPPGS
jgi:hypothetical protein